MTGIAIEKTVAGERVPEHAGMIGASHGLHGAQNHGNNQHTVRNELNRRDRVFRVHHARYQHDTGSDRQHGIIRDDGGIDKGLPVALTAERQKKHRGDQRKNRQRIDEAVKARPVQRRKGCAADARKTLHPFRKEDEKIAEEQPRNGRIQGGALESRHIGTFLSA